ncbi:Protein TusB [Escherichia coli]|nr:Protein TusB [Escherichia coli]
MLHTLHRSPWLTDFAALLRLLSEGDELLLLQDGVTAAVDGNRYLTLKVCVMPPLRSMP